MSPSSSKILFYIGAVLPTAAFFVASALVYQTTPPEWAAPKEAPPAVDAPKITYVDLDEPIDFAVYNGRIRVSMALAFAVRLGPMELLTLSAKVNEVENAVKAEMTDAILAEASDEKSSKDLGARLRQSLPPILLSIINRRLATEEIPAPVEEVLILDMMISAG